MFDWQNFIVSSIEFGNRTIGVRLGSITELFDWIRRVFGTSVSYNPLSEGFPKTDCHIVLNSMSFILEAFATLSI